MKTKLLLLIITSIFLTNSYSQEQCGTMKNLEEQIKKDPSIKERMLQIEKQNQEWIEKNGRGFKKHIELESNKNFKSYSKSSLNTNNLCGYNNTYFTTISAPTTLNSIVSPSPNCTYGGEYVRVNNLIAGRTYRISTIGVNNFDTQITIYRAGGTGGAVAFNDDWQTSVQSEIYFTPIYSDNYDILINQYGCNSIQLCASLEVELWYIPRSVITIPVVVHVIHNGEPIGTGTNISDAQIQSQIDTLNEDFRRLNSNINSTPAVFRGTSADLLIQFCLAQQKPDGIITNGITRHLQPSQTDYIQLGYPSELQCLNKLTIENIIKPTTIWNRDKYLNIWVSDMRQLPTMIFGQTNPDVDNNQGCNLQSITLGYAQFPGMVATPQQPHPELTDGVWIRYDVFGRIGNLNTSFNLGRTATHEIGHWLNLKHIWGDEPACAADDDVIDTPIQSNKSSGCNIFPKTDLCSLNYPGIMFQNYMDYSNDSCLSVYTFGQSARIDATLFNQRASLLTSQGCIPGILGNNQYEKLNIIIYPNPTSSKVFFDNSKEYFKEVNIYNYLGQEVKRSSFKTYETNQEIDLSSLSSGVYVLKFIKENNISSLKIIKE